MATPTPGPTVVVLQPAYLPWLGFFDQMLRADVFVYYDDVQYDKHGWRNRNRIKTQNGPQWLTVPVRHAGFPRIIDVEIDNRSRWASKHLTSISQAYARAPYLREYLPTLEDLLTRRWERLVDLDLAVAAALAQWFGLSTRIERASELAIEGDRTERLVSICERFGAATYLSGNAAKDYLDVAMFAQRGIRVVWQDFTHPVYPQRHGTFIPYLSALDLLLNCGPASREMLENGRRHEATAVKVEQQQ